MNLHRLILLAAGLGVLAACAESSRSSGDLGGGDPERGAVIIVREACGACHQIPGIQAADGQVGPPLGGVGRRTIIAGMLANTPQNMAYWVRRPQAVVPGNAMPDVGLSEAQARDVAAYLETLR